MRPLTRGIWVTSIYEGIWPFELFCAMGGLRIYTTGQTKYAKSHGFSGVLCTLLRELYGSD